MNNLKLLEDQRPYNEIVKDHAWKQFRRLASKNSEYKKIHSLLMNYVESKISLKKNLANFPYYKRGEKGYLLSDSSVNIIRERERLQALENMANKGCKMCLFEETFLLLPSKYFKILKNR